MKAYIIAQFTPNDKEMLQIYSAKAATTIASYEGEFLAKSEVIPLVGESRYKYNAIIAFPTKELANHWFNSPEYQELTAVRNKAMDATFLLAS